VDSDVRSNCTDPDTVQIKGSKWSLNHLPYPWTMAKHAAMGLVARNVSKITVVVLH
jgi:hypothetical protein